MFVVVGIKINVEGPTTDAVFGVCRYGNEAKLVYREKIIRYMGQINSDIGVGKQN